MKKLALLAMTAICATALTAYSSQCEGHDHSHDAENTDKEITATIGCYGCIFKGEGAKGCQAAVKIDGEAMLIGGEGKPNAHTTGLCKASKEAKLTGEVKDGKFIATKVEPIE